MHLLFFHSLFKLKETVQNERYAEFVGISLVLDRDVERTTAGIVRRITDIVRIAVTQLDARSTLQLADEPELRNFVPF